MKRMGPDPIAPITDRELDVDTMRQQGLMLTALEHNGRWNSRF